MNSSLVRFMKGMLSIITPALYGNMLERSYLRDGRSDDRGYGSGSELVALRQRPTMAGCGPPYWPLRMCYCKLALHMEPWPARAGMRSQ